MDKIYEVRISKQAERQLKEIFQYISYTLQAPGTAEKMLDILKEFKHCDNDEFSNEIIIDIVLGNNIISLN